MSGAQHSSENALWYTPEDHLALVVRVLGDIDLDPCTDAHGASRTLAATNITENGHLVDWPKGDKPLSVYMNPPGGRTEGKKGKSYPFLFWEKLIEYRRLGRLRHAIVAAFSIEQLQQTQRSSFPMMAFPVCVPRTRTKWVPPEGRKAKSPTHANAYVYVPGVLDHTAEFMQVFSALGWVKR